MRLLTFRQRILSPLVARQEVVLGRIQAGEVAGSKPAAVHSQVGAVRKPGEAASCTEVATFL